MNWFSVRTDDNILYENSKEEKQYLSKQFKYLSNVNSQLIQFLNYYLDTIILIISFNCTRHMKQFG